MKTQDIRSIINAYSRLTTGHPFNNFGDRIKITVNDDCPIRECTVQTQYEERDKEEKFRPYKGWNVEPRKYFRISEVDQWSYNLLVPEDFTDRKTFVDVVGSAHVEGCAGCTGKGRSTCITCMGKGKDVCPECHGDYKHLTCSKCDGDGKMACRACGGKGEQMCSKCGGTGRVVENVNEWRTHWDYQQQKNVGGYEWVKKEMSCSACGGRGHWRCSSCKGTCTEHCTACDGRGFVTCKSCTQGYLLCKTCGGKGDLICQTCGGAGKNELRYVVNRTLSQKTLRKYICDARVREFAETVDFEFDTVDFKVRDKSLADRELYPEDVRCSSTLSKQVARTAPGEGRILFQEAMVQSVASTYVEYEFDGDTYKGIICNGEFNSIGDSPIDEWASGLIGKAERKMKRGSSVSTIKMLDQAEMAGGDKHEIRDLRRKAFLKLDRLYSSGVSTAFWFFFVVVTPVIYNFYLKLNPVMSWAILANNPKWRFYGLLPLVQVLIFIGAMLIFRACFSGRSKSIGEKSYDSIWLYFAKGFGEFFLACLAALAGLVLINFLGISILTTFVIGIIISIIALVIAIAVLLIKWIVGIFA